MSHKPSSVRYLTVTLLTLAAALAYLCRNSIGVAESTIRTDLGLTMNQSGWFMGCFFWTYAVFQIPTGWYSERYGSRLSMSLYAIGWSVAMVGIAFSPWFSLLVVAHLILGIAQAGIFPAACQTIGYWMPLSQRSFSCGLLTAGMQIGAIIAATATGAWMVRLDWRWVFVVYAVPGLIWAAGFGWWFRNRPSQVKAVNSLELAVIAADSGVTRGAGEGAKRGMKSEWRELVSIFGSSMMWLLCGQQICRSAGYMFFASWFPTFLQETRGVTVAQSGMMQGLVFGGTFAGCLVGGSVTDWIWKRTGSMRLSRSGVGTFALGACSALILGAWFVDSSTMAVYLIAVGAFFAALAGPCAFATTIDIGGERVPQVFGTMNMFGNFAAAACPVIIAWFFEWAENWNLVLVLFAGVYLLGAICWVLVNPRSAIKAS